MSSQSGQPSQQPAITDEDVLSRTLKVCGLQYWMDKNFLFNCFSFTEMLTSVKVIKNDDTGPLEGGDGFMEFKTHDFAERVLKMYNGAYMPDGVNKFILEWPTFIPEDNLGKYVISVGNLSNDVNDFVLEMTFRLYYNSVKEAKVEIDEITGVSKGHGFVKFNDKIEQMRALAEMQGELCSNRPMHIEPITKENYKGLKTLKDEASEGDIRS